MDRSDRETKMTRCVLWLVALVVLAVPATAELRHGDQAVVVTDTPRGTVNVRTIPVERTGGTWGMGAQIGRASEGDLFKFLEKRTFGNQGVWVRVEREDGSEAWISGRYLTQTIARDRLVVLPTAVNVRSRASTSSRKIGQLKQGDVLGRVRKQDNWYLAVLPDGNTRGWVREDMVRLEPLSPVPAETPPEPAEAPPPEPEKPKVDYRDVAEQAADEGRIDDAIEAYLKALEEAPNDGVLHFEVGKLLDRAGRPGEAIPHLRKAIRGRPARPEAEFTLKKLIDAREQAAAAPHADAEAPVDDPDEEDVSETGSAILQVLADNAVYILPTAALGSLGFIAILVLLYRRRGFRSTQPSFRRRKPDGGFDDVLKYAVEKRPVIREIEEAEKKLTEMDEALAKRFATFKETDESGRPRLPPGESAERLLKRIDGLRKTILNQEERARVYADLVTLQNEKISALDEEIEALKKLIQLDYRGAGDKGAKPKPQRAETPPPTQASGD